VKKYLLTWIKIVVKTGDCKLIIGGRRIVLGQLYNETKGRVIEERERGGRWSGKW